MREDERDEKRAVNPSMRRDEPGEEPELRRPDADPVPVEGTQGAELNPRHEGGIAE